MVTSKLVRVVLWMIGALLSFSVMAVSIRELSRGGLSIFEILAIRSGVALLVLLPLLAEEERGTPGGTATGTGTLRAAAGGGSAGSRTSPLWRLRGGK